MVVRRDKKIKRQRGHKTHGYGSMKELVNWRWSEKFGAGPLCGRGSHQIDAVGWLLGALNIILNNNYEIW